MELKSTLQQLGLTENESQVYLIILRLGTATITEITEKTHIHRVNVYDIVKRLQEKGLISYIIKGKRKHYQTMDLLKLVEIEKEKLKQLQQIMPQLQELKKLGKEPEEATIIKDKKGIKNILEEITKSKTPVCHFASGWGFHENFPEYKDIWYKKLKENKIKIRCLISRAFKPTEIPEPLQFRYLLDEYILPSTTAIYEDKVFIIAWGVMPIGILIKSKEISKSYKKFFELLWRTAKKT